MNNLDLLAERNKGLSIPLGVLQKTSRRCLSSSRKGAEELNLKVDGALDVKLIHKARNQLCYINPNVKRELFLFRVLGGHFLAQHLM